MNTMNKATARVHASLAVLPLVLGAVLLAYMITVEGEMGAVPLLLLAAGAGWLYVARVRRRPSGAPARGADAATVETDH